LVALLKDYYGRGPEQAKTYVSDDLVVCLLRGGFTPVEQTLKEGGYGGVEEATGRRVVGFMSGNQQDPDMICEVFVLAHHEMVHLPANL
jgi:uncharacterized protein YbcI